MKIVLIGEAADHAGDLRRGLHGPYEIVALPAEAAGSAGHDALIGTDDVVVSLRWSRPDGVIPTFRLLHVPGAGLDAIDMAALDPQTTIANVFEHEIPIAEFVLARLLEWQIRAAAMQAAFTPSAWPRHYRHRMPHGELHGTTLGIVGYGRIGQAIAVRAAAFGMRVRAVDDRVTAAGTAPDGIAELAPAALLPDVVAGCDAVVLACPLTPSTTRLVDASLLDRMPAHAVLVNISRAEIADEAALYTALRTGRIGGAILDVWYRYPTSPREDVAPAQYPFWELPNAWCTPHSSAWTHQLPRRRYAVVAENVNRLVSGEPLRNVVRAAHQQGL
ncbi:NAD(P)-dependent oxidoreductase [Pseudonocardia sp. GCM10023141]|uniref:NAD(P)-dependent oxidoreductase n=1 Tax=Pseudonocardia sp. GCM10023141 TaxID=3252653 RepID=UPI0036242E7A